MTTFRPLPTSMGPIDRSPEPPAPEGKTPPATIDLDRPKTRGGGMVGTSGMMLFVALAVIGLALQEGFLVALGGMGALTIAVSWVWFRLSPEHLSYQRTFGARRLFAGEEMDFTVELHNAKPLPLPRVKVEDDFPEGLALQDGELRITGRPRVYNLPHAASLAWYESIRWQYRMRCDHRGFYRFGPAHVQTGDLFGFFTTTTEDRSPDHLLVYPQVIPLPELGLPARRPFGELTSQSWLFQDPTRPAGIRDYQPGDTMRHVDWKATARTGSVKVREFESPTTHSVVIALNLDTLGVGWRGFSGEHLERAVSAAASLAHDTLERGHAVGLLTNGTSVVYERPMNIPPARNTRQHVLIFETLAMVGPYLSGALEDVMLSHRARLPYGATVALVTGVLPDSLVQASQELQRSGYAVQILYVGDALPETPVPPSLPLFHLGPHFQEREAVEA